MTRPAIGYLAGTNEPQHNGGMPGGLLHAVATELGPGYDHQQIPYPAAFGSPMDYAHSVAWGEERTRVWVRDTYARTGIPPWLVGFSQGAVVVGNVAMKQYPAEPIAGIVVLGDGMRHRSQSTRPPGVRLDGWGLAGERFVGHRIPRVYSLALPADPIANASRDSLWRNASDLIEYMSVRDPIEWARQVGLRLGSRRWQNEHLTRPDQWLNTLRLTPQRVATASAELGNYLRVHPSYGSAIWQGRQTYTGHAAELIARG